MSPRPIVIAHRGASGYLPEHTLVAKALAYGLGADYLEQDVVATRDRKLVVLHDIYLDDVSDVRERFPNRSREDGRYYVIDFDLEELRTLTAVERRVPGGEGARFPERFPIESAFLRIATLEEELRLVQGLNRSMRRTVGIYPEIKEPVWHRRHGIDLTQLLLAELQDFGYSRATDPVFVQCFDPEELARVKNELGSELKLIQLVAPEARYQELLTGTGLRRVAGYACGLGPHFSQLVDGPPGAAPHALPLCRAAQALGLRLHPYTFRRDELPPYATTLEELLELFLGHVRVDGVFCDHPDVAVRVRNSIEMVQ